MEGLHRALLESSNAEVIWNGDQVRPAWLLGLPKTPALAQGGHDGTLAWISSPSLCMAQQTYCGIVFGVYLRLRASAMSGHGPVLLGLAGPFL